MLNPEYSIDRDQPTSQASPLRINVLLSGVFRYGSTRMHLPKTEFADTHPLMRPRLLPI